MSSIPCTGYHGVVISVAVRLGQVVKLACLDAFQERRDLRPRVGQDRAVRIPAVAHVHAAVSTGTHLGTAPAVRADAGLPPPGCHDDQALRKEVLTTASHRSRPATSEK